MTPRLSGYISIFGLVFFMLKTLLGIARQWSRPSRLGVMERGLSEDSEVVRASHLPPNVAWIRISKATSPRALNSFSLFLVLILAERVHFLGSSVFPSTKELNWKIRSGTREHAKTNQFFTTRKCFVGQRITKQITIPVVIATQHNPNDILANVVYISLHSG